MTPTTGAAAGRFLSDYYGSVIIAEPAGVGMWSRCFGFEHDGARLVVRFGQHVGDFECDRVAADFARPGLPIPQVHEIGETVDGYYAISDRVDGTPLEECPADRWPSLVPAVTDALVTMRDVPPAGPGWGGWGSDGVAASSGWRDHLLAIEEDAVDARTHGTRERLRDHPDGDACFRWALGLLESVASDDVPRSVIHCDLINRNVHLVGDTITGIFDWGCGRYGDPLYELAWFDFWAPWHPNLDARPLFGTTGDPVDSDRYLACLLHIGIDHLGYNAKIGDEGALEATAARTRAVVDRFS
jgi:hygromycin-B 4-O-kinase